MWMRYAVPLTFVGFLLIFLLFHRQRPAFSIVCRIVAGILLIWKIIEYIYTPLVPTELSHLSYLIIGVSLTFFLKPFYFGSGALGLISALGYLIGVILNPAIFLRNMSLPIVIRGIFTHGLLFFLSLYLLFYGFECKKRYMVFPIIVAALALFMNWLQINGYISIPYFDPNGKALVMILDGSLLSYVFSSYPTWAIYVTQVGIYIAFLLLLLALNRLSYLASDYKKNHIV